MRGFRQAEGHDNLGYKSAPSRNNSLTAARIVLLMATVSIANESLRNNHCLSREDGLLPTSFHVYAVWQTYITRNV